MMEVADTSWGAVKTDFNFNKPGFQVKASVFFQLLSQHIAHYSLDCPDAVKEADDNTGYTQGRFLLNE